MGTVFDCRKNNIVAAADKVETGKYLIVGFSKQLPQHNDLMISDTGEIYVFDMARPGDEPDQFEARLFDTQTAMKSLVTPSYRKLSRAIFSQLKRDYKNVTV